MIQVQEPPATGSAKIVRSYCHHRGHRNQLTKPYQLKKCVNYTFCRIKDKHPEYFNKLSTLMVDLKRKQKEIQDLENQAKAMEDFSSNNEFHFIKNLTPHSYSVDPLYKTNKPKLMRDVHMLCNFLNGKIPPVCSDDWEQLRILLTKCKKIFKKSPILLICLIKLELSLMLSTVKTRRRLSLVSVQTERKKVLVNNRHLN